MLWEILNNRRHENIPYTLQVNVDEATDLYDSLFCNGCYGDNYRIKKLAILPSKI